MTVRKAAENASRMQKYGLNRTQKKIKSATCEDVSISSVSSQYIDFTTAATAGLMLSQFIF